MFKHSDRLENVSDWIMDIWFLDRSNVLVSGGNPPGIVDSPILDTLKAEQVTHIIFKLIKRLFEQISLDRCMSQQVLGPRSQSQLVQLPL